MRECEVVVLSKFPEIFEGFKESLSSQEDAKAIKKIVVLDHDGRPLTFAHDIYSDWYSGYTGAPFQMARNANFGWACAGESKDIFYAGDDVRFTEPDTIKRLQEMAYSDDKLGILSPRIVGTAQAVQMSPTVSPITYAPFVAFVCVYIKREVIEKVGFLDERFEGYGHEDCDYCVRARQAGFTVGVAKDISVKHGVNGHSYGSTFIKVRGEVQMGRDDAENRRRFAEKYGIQNTPQRTWEFMEKLS